MKKTFAQFFRSKWLILYIVVFLISCLTCLAVLWTLSKRGLVNLPIPSSSTPVPIQVDTENSGEGLLQFTPKRRPFLK